MRIGTVALTLVILAFLASAIPFRQIIDHRNRLEEAKVNLAALEVENVLLADEVLALSTPAEIERMARENLGYVMPGEIAYVVLSPEVSETVPVVVDATETEVSWWRHIWNYLTGADSSE